MSARDNDEYTNEDNPFGDSNLNETFVWRKKYETMGIKHIDKDEIEAINKRKMVKNRQELEKVKQRRLERERERELRQEEISAMQREREAEQFKDWLQQEDVFHLRQAKLRSKLRIREGRAKPIDLLARYINVFGENIETKCEHQEQDDAEASTDSSRFRMQKQRREEEEEDLQDKIRFLSVAYLAEPYNTLNGLRIKDMEDLQEDIKIYLELDSGTKINADYWKDLQVIVEDELTKLKLANMDSQERRREGINPSVSADIAKILKGKTPQQLKNLHRQIEKKIAAREEGIDIGYWETLLSRLKAQISRARLWEFHEENLKKRPVLIAQHSKEIEDLQPPVQDGSESDQQPGPSGINQHHHHNRHEARNDEMEFLSKTELRQKCIQDYESGRYSPANMLPLEECNSERVLMTVEDFERDLMEQREATLRKLAAFPVPFVAVDKKPGDKKQPQSYDHNVRKLNQAEESFVREARKGMGDDEAIFSVEEELIAPQDLSTGPGSSGYARTNPILLKDKYSWAEKYRPRKPRYFNRVHTGFEWNKYNQTHYDVDNPPPKVVQGYKFNIFYPDLIDKSVTPTYKITPCPGHPDFAFIRFSAGPPYEDICFKIVNREWNFSYKSGFRCQFQNNILQLWFHFKRYRYRR